MNKWKALGATLIVMAMMFPPALPAQSDLESLARDLERVLGKGRVEVRSTTPHATSARVTSLSDRALVAAMNRRRVAAGLPPLQLNSRLSLAAGDRIGDMFSKRYFAHVAPDGTQPFVWVAQRGYRYRAIGENLAVGYRSADAVVDGWMRSPGHRQNILGSGFDEIGVAIANGSPTRRYTGPTVVALYASR